MGASASSLPCEPTAAAIMCSEQVVERLMVGKDSSGNQAELARQDEFWRERLRDEDDTFSCRRGLSLAAFQRVAGHTEKLYANTMQSPACHVESLRQQIQTCYMSNEGSTLLCRDLVDTFNKCVDAVKPKDPNSE